MSNPYTNPWIDDQLNQVEATVHGAWMGPIELKEVKLRLESLLRVVTEDIELRKDEGEGPE